MSTYEPLNKIIPENQALAFKAIQAGFQQIKGITNTTADQLGPVVSQLESNTDLPLITALISPLPQNVVDFWTQQLAVGTGANDTLVLCDVIGTPSGWVHNTALADATAQISDLTAENALLSLTNATDGVYTVMEKCLNGVYTLGSYYVQIPGGLPGAGTYGTFGTAAAAQADAFTLGLNPALISALTAIKTAYPTQSSQADQDFSDMAAQINRENINLQSAGVDFDELSSTYNYSGLVTSLAPAGLDTVAGGAAYFFEAIANVTSIGGQAVISTMRQARNQVLLQAAGLQIEPLVSDVVTVPLATLDVSQYTVAQATAQKIV